MRMVSKNLNDTHRYDDLYHLDYCGSKNHKHMTMMQRAAQFAPFDALSGYKEALEEDSRLTVQKIDLSEEACEKIQQCLLEIQGSISTHPKVCVMYFVEDATKDGGRYVCVEKCVKKIALGKLVFTDKTFVVLDDIMYIEKAPS